ncbi:MAG TPA: translation initiation factor IF-1 [Patescibacteria group bacterium]|nr:translation initiation factor IF-1 [Patescibacteria group bacterium]
MAHQGSIEKDGVVQESLPNTLFRVKLEDESIILCHLSGKLRMNFIKILPGDRVKVEMTPYDIGKGRITLRYREGGAAYTGFKRR